MILAIMALCLGEANAQNNMKPNQKQITQTAGRSVLGEFAPEFAHLNDDVFHRFLPYSKHVAKVITV